METLSPQEITRLLADWNAGDAEALERLAPLVYAELRRIARRQMGGEREGHTLQATALVNEAYLRLAGGEGLALQDRAHFYAVCAQLMRHVLVDHARAHVRGERRGAVAAFVIMFGAFLLQGNHPFVLPFSFALAVAYIFVAARFGMLALAPAEFVFLIVEFYPYTTNLSGWYARSPLSATRFTVDPSAKG